MWSFNIIDRTICLRCKHKTIDLIKSLGDEAVIHLCQHTLRSNVHLKIKCFVCVCVCQKISPSLKIGTFRWSDHVPLTFLEITQILRNSCNIYVYIYFFLLFFLLSIFLQVIFPFFFFYLIYYIFTINVLCLIVKHWGWGGVGCSRQRNFLPEFERWLKKEMVVLVCMPRAKAPKHADHKLSPRPYMSVFNTTNFPFIFTSFFSVIWASKSGRVVPEYPWAEPRKVFNYLVTFGLM